MAGTYREIIDAEVDERLAHFWELALDIHAHPQIMFEETYASELNRAELIAAGFEVENPVAGLDTAYIATHTTGDGPTIGIMGELDALPVLGHACGHNLSSTSATLAGIAAAKAMDECGVTGTVKVIGTPAEEDGGGKIIMLNAGAFEGIDAMLLMHATSAMTRVAGACCSSATVIAKFHGRPAQAQSHPENGVNAMDATTLLHAAIGLTRQQLPDDVHISCVITDISHDGISIPEFSTVEMGVSAMSAAHLTRGVETVKRIAQGCAIATGCEYETSETTGYLGRLANEAIGAVEREELRDLGEPTQDGLPEDKGGEDFGDVSRAIPGAQMFVSMLPERKISGHTEEFRELARTEPGRHVLVTCGKALARTALNLMMHPEIVEAAEAERTERLASEG